MTENTKIMLDQVVRNLDDVQSDSFWVYWTMLIGIGLLFTTVIIAIFKTTGIFLLIAASFALWVTTFKTIWKEQRTKEKLQAKKLQKKNETPKSLP